jgi:hypothetical protein
MGTTFMDYDAVRGISNGFDDAAQVLDAINKALEAAMMTLKMTAFVGLVGGFAVQAFIEQLQPRVEFLARECQEYAEKLNTAIQTAQQAEQAGDSL